MAIKNRIRRAEQRLGASDGSRPLRIIWTDIEEQTYFLDGREITKEEYEELIKDSQVIEWSEGE